MDHKILLIDDSAILRRIAINVLDARAGCGEVVTATRATEGFARACASGARLILVDYQIAGFPKAGFCQRLLDEPRTSRVPVVLLLGPGMTPPPRESVPANIVDYLVKPFTPEQLLSTVQSALDGVIAEAPVRRLPEAGKNPAVPRPEVLEDHHEVAVALSAAAVARRETSRFAGSRRPVGPTSPASFAPTRERDIGTSPMETARLRNALLAAAERGETGILRIRAGAGAATEVYLESGQIVVVATRDARRYGEDADGVVPPKVCQSALTEAMDEQARSGVPFFLGLGSCGLISKSAAVGMMHRFGQRYFARLWPEPSEALVFEYNSLDALPGFALRLEPRPESVDAWLLEAARSLEPKDIAAIVRREGFSGVPRLCNGEAPPPEKLPLCDQERGFVRLVDGRRTLAAFATGLGVTLEHAFLLLYRLRCLGLTDYRPAGSAFVVTPRTSVRRVLPLQR